MVILIFAPVIFFEVFIHVSGDVWIDKVIIEIPFIKFVVFCVPGKWKPLAIGDGKGMGNDAA